MKLQPNKNYKSDDVVMTPLSLCKRIVDYFNPDGTILEPCKGTGNFLVYLPKDRTAYCEMSEGIPFEDYKGKVNWIITNPPWSKMRLFLNLSFKVANHVVFLITINHVFTKARIRDMKNNNFGIKEILYVDTPKEFPQMGFQLGVIHYERNWQEETTIKDLP